MSYKWKKEDVVITIVALALAPLAVWGYVHFIEAPAKTDSVQWVYEDGLEGVVEVHDCEFLTAGSLKCLITNRSTSPVSGLRATGYTADGVKIDDDSIDQSLAPGETGQERFVLFQRSDGVAKVVVHRR